MVSCSELESDLGGVDGGSELGRDGRVGRCQLSCNNVLFKSLSDFCINHSPA